MIFGFLTKYRNYRARAHTGPVAIPLLLLLWVWKTRRRVDGKNLNSRNRLFQPMTLNCGHVFCQFCIQQWRVKCQKRGFNCPNCREPVTSCTKSFHLENLIDSMFQDIDVSVLEERNEILESRKGMIPKLKPSKLSMMSILLSKFQPKLKKPK